MNRLRGALSPLTIDLAILLVAVVISVVFWLVDLYGNSTRQLIAGGIALGIFAAVAAAFLLARRTEPARPRSFAESRRFTLLAGSFLVAAVFLARYTAVTGFPLWSEEIGWAEIAHRITDGDRWNPFMAKSDYPSSFQAFPIALLVHFGVSSALASRILAVVFLIGSVYYFGRLCRELLTPVDSWFGAVFPLLLAVFSTFSWIMVMTGWHEITHVNLIVFACWYYGIRAIKYQERSAAIGLAFWCGIALWTLYTPVVFAISMALVVLTSIAGSVPSRNKVTLICWSALVSSPIIGLMIGSRGGIFSRHIAFYLSGGEWSGTTFGATGKSPLEVYRMTAVQLWQDVMPIWGPFDWEAAMRPHAEPLAFALALIGVLAILLSRRRLLIGGILVPAVAMVIGLVLSNPTPWRESYLSAAVMVLAGAGFASLYRVIKAPKRMILAAAFVGLLVVAQGAAFARRSVYLEGFQYLERFAGGKAAIAGTAFAKQWLETSSSGRILVADDPWARYITVDMPKAARVTGIRSPGEIRREVCQPSCLWLGYTLPQDQGNESAYEASLSKLALRTTKSVFFSPPGLGVGYAIAVGPERSVAGEPDQTEQQLGDVARPSFPGGFPGTMIDELEAPPDRAETPPSLRDDLIDPQNSPPASIQPVVAVAAPDLDEDGEQITPQTEDQPLGAVERADQPSTRYVGGGAPD